MEGLSGNAGVVAVIIGLIYIVGLMMAIHAISNTRTTQGAIAWAMALVFVPFISVPLYVVFGRNRFRGYSQLIDESNKEVISRNPDVKIKSDVDKASLTPVRAAQVSVVENLADLPMSTNSSFKLLIDGQEMFDGLFEAIKTAEQYILVEYYILRADNIGQELANHLIDKAKIGVDVYVMYDAIGSLSTPASYFDKMKDAGIKTVPFMSTRGKNSRFQVNFRNHRKIVVVDGKIGLFGGHNVGDEYLGRDEKVGNWRDTSVIAEGGVVRGLQLAFQQDWYWSTREILDLNWQVCEEHKGSQPGIVIPTGPAGEMENGSLMFLHLINSSVERLWLISPYFVPDIDIMAAIELAILRGVDVRLMVPYNSDSLLVGWAVLAKLPRVLLAGVKVYQYEDGFLHQKLMLIDKDVTVIGTANLDNRSLRLNFEVMTVVADEKFANETEAMLMDDFKKCREYTMEDFDNESMFKLALINISNLFAPLL